LQDEEKTFLYMFTLRFVAGVNISFHCCHVGRCNTWCLYQRRKL